MNGNVPAISRRRFLAVASASLAAPIIVSAASREANSRLNIGMIGIGKQGEFHVGQLRHYRDTVQIVAVAEVYRQFRDRAVQMAGGPGVCTGYNDFREMLARPDIDAVLIATPDHWHAIQAIESARACKDVFCEKPLSLTIREARAMVNAARSYNRVFQTGSMQRSSPEFHRACQLVRNGYIGRIQRVEVNVGGPSVDCQLPEEPIPDGLDWDMWLGPAPYRPFNAVLRPPHNNSFPNWRSFRDYSGGGMTDWGAHHFDIAQWGLGMDGTGPVEIIPPNGKDVRALTYVYANGIPMLHTGRGGITFFGTEGTVFVNRGIIETKPESLRTMPFKPSDVQLYVSRNHHEDWLSAIRKRTRPICDAEIGCRSVTVCHLGNIAYWMKRPLKWDPQKESFVNDELANRWLSRAYRGGWTLPLL